MTPTQALTKLQWLNVSVCEATNILSKLHREDDVRSSLVAARGYLRNALDYVNALLEEED